MMRNMIHSIWINQRMKIQREQIQFKLAKQMTKRYSLKKFMMIL